MNDALTDLCNRAWLDDMLSKLVATAKRTGGPLSVVMIDLDHFKRFNDTHGHLAGDDALRAAAGVLNAALRPLDFAVRYGGEEMVLPLPETSDKLATVVAGRLWQVVIFGDMRRPMPHLTGSFGVTTLGTAMDELQLLTAADAALYRARQAGRDQVSV